MSQSMVPASLRRLPVLGSSEVHDKCERCGGLCCTYFALQIDTPRSWDDFDDLRWYVAHGGVEVYKEGRSWYLQVQTRCNHLEPSGLCEIYENRPRICRQHKVEGCEFENQDPFDYSVHFRSSGEVWDYMQRRWPKGRPPSRRKRPARALPRALSRRA